MTPKANTSPVKINVSPPTLYFSIYYRDAEHSFRRASETVVHAIKSGDSWNPGRDKFLAIEVYTETEFATAWTRIGEEAENGGYVVAEGHLFTHASKPGGENSGLEFAAVPGTGDGTINRSEMMNLPVLPWRKTGRLFLHGCNTGRAGERRNWTPAEVLADSQNVEATGTLGFSYFSTSPEVYSKITENSPKIYLLPFKRGKNAIFGDGSIIPTRIFLPKK